MRLFPILLGLTALLLSGCAGQAKPEAPGPTAAITQPSAPSAPETTEIGETVEPQLMALTDTRAEAEDIARQYGITLVSWQDGLALFFTEEDPETVLRRGETNGWPELSLNHQRELF